ncbi:hypothetical protein [Cellulomonas xiejunii]|nr:hypothetical protein [Cellulomonas xiejunii]MCC2322284.1 hypothetical protein [Cellulomonas xiejunii]
MMMDQGPSVALDELLDFATANWLPSDREGARRDEVWIREQAAAADPK